MQLTFQSQFNKWFLRTIHFHCLSLVLSQRLRAKSREAKENRKNNTMFVFSFICLFS
jgi:hypothetical protein